INTYLSIFIFSFNTLLGSYYTISLLSSFLLLFIYICYLCNLYYYCIYLISCFYLCLSSSKSIFLCISFTIIIMQFIDIDISFLLYDIGFLCFVCFSLQYL
ncbi:Hypothetical protein EHI5A_214840, partial [Entamoeba histolytica KU27]